MKDNRLSKWKEKVFVQTFLAGENEVRLNAVSELQVEAMKENENDENKLSSLGITQACRELIFDIKEGEPVFHCIIHMFDTDRMQIKIEHALNIIYEKENPEEDLDDEVCNTLAIASAVGVPVFPNTASVAPQLAKYHRKMLIDGFTAPDGEGGKKKLKLTRSLADRPDSPGLLNKLDPTEAILPADLLLIRETISREIEELTGAKTIIEGIKQAIAELSALLDQTTRNENAVQTCLTSNPILFGPDYKQIIPKHRFGAEFELDYALVRHSGVIDLVEIESPSLSLFNKKGNPSSHLIHAEQQVLDWLSWAESNNSYAQKTLPGLSSPIGFVVIGRARTLDEKEVAKLKARNALFNGKLYVLTYDDLLDRSRQILRTLLGVGRSSK